MTKEWRDTALWWSTCLFCGLLLVAHFSLVQLMNMPMSPLRLRVVNLAYNYVNPFFTQNWSFFAPQPVDRSYAMLARAKYDDPQSGQSVATDWLDVSDTLIDSVRQHRLTSLFHVEIGLSNALTSFVNKLGSDPRATFYRDGKNYVKLELPSDIDPTADIVMKRTAIASLEEAHPGIEFREVQIGIATNIFSRFTERNAGKSGEWAFSILPWEPAEWVAPYCCWAGGDRDHARWLATRSGKP